jgi:hypothetical protein
MRLQKINVGVVADDSCQTGLPDLIQLLWNKYKSPKSGYLPKK